MIAPSSRPVRIFACLGQAWSHIVVALYLTLVLVIEPIWQRPYDEVITPWALGPLLLALAAPVQAILAAARLLPSERRAAAQTRSPT